jgi:hypothetical protein
MLRMLLSTAAAVGIAAGASAQTTPDTSAPPTMQTPPMSTPQTSPDPLPGTPPATETPRAPDPGMPGEPTTGPTLDSDADGVPDSEELPDPVTR